MNDITINKQPIAPKAMQLEIVAGKEKLQLRPFSNKVIMRQDADRIVSFDTLTISRFRFVDYDWEGPVYQTVTKTKEKSKGKSKEKRKGGLGGAVVGTLIFPGVGTAIGYAMASKKKGKNKGRVNTTAVEGQEETDSIARITLQNINNGEQLSIGIKCNTKIDIDLDRFDWTDTEEPEPVPAEAGATTSTDNIPAEVSADSGEMDKIRVLKEYKALMDAGILTQEEFEAKKKELLGLA